MTDLKSIVSNFFSRMFKKLKKEQETFPTNEGESKADIDTLESYKKPIYPVDVLDDDPWNTTNDNGSVKKSSISGNQTQTNVTQDKSGSVKDANHSVKEEKKESVAKASNEKRIAMPSGVEFIDLVSGTAPISLFARQVKFLENEKEFYVTDKNFKLIYKIRQLYGQKKYTIWNPFDEKLAYIDMSLTESDKYIVRIDGKKDMFVYKRNSVNEAILCGMNNLYKHLLYEIDGLMDGISENNIIDDRIFVMHEIKDEDLIAEITDKKSGMLENTVEAFNLNVKLGADKLQALSIAFITEMENNLKYI